MKCPFCSTIGAKVIDSRTASDGTFVKRRRECENCGKRFSTFETIERVELMVIKKDGSRVPFDREKIKRGILRACEKRPVTMTQIENMVHNVTRKMYLLMEKEVHSEKIGELIMEELKETDKVAYIRFASVYRDFRDIDSFTEELKKLAIKN